MTKQQGCYPGCFYYTDSCFREDCKNKQQLFEPENKFEFKLFDVVDEVEFNLFKDD